MALPTTGAPSSASSDDPLVGLMARLAVGDERALSELYDATSHRVYGLALRILRTNEAAEEATLDVYAQLWRRPEQFDPERGSVASYLLTLARTRSLDLQRSRARRAGIEEPLDEIDLAAPGPSPELAARDVFAAKRLHRALAALSGEQRSAIVAAYFGGLSHSEVAAALDQPLGTVKTRIRDGLIALRREMAVQEGGRP
jgi:RNA polymerase sigma-70 factor (ECF subfamily)